MFAKHASYSTASFMMESQYFWKVLKEQVSASITDIIRTLPGRTRPSQAALQRLAFRRVASGGW